MKMKIRGVLIAAAVIIGGSFAHTAFCADSFTGEWAFYHDNCKPCGPMKLAQNKDLVSGSYKNPDGSRGVVSCYLEGRVCRGVFTNSNRDSGLLEWTLATDQMSFKGYYEFNGNRYNWNADKK